MQFGLANGKATKTLTARDLLPEQKVWIGVTDEGLVSRTHDDKQPRQSGNDAPRWLVSAGDDGLLRLWPLTSGDRTGQYTAAMSRLARGAWPPRHPGGDGHGFPGGAVRADAEADGRGR